MIKEINKFFKDEEGATMVEYALMVALVALFCITAVTLMRDQIAAAFNAVVAALTPAN